jgi:hypothetical protein
MLATPTTHHMTDDERDGNNGCRLRGAGALLDWLSCRGEYAQYVCVSASLLGLGVSYQGRELDGAQVVLHRPADLSDESVGPVATRPPVPGEFLG